MRPLRFRSLALIFLPALLVSGTAARGGEPASTPAGSLFQQVIPQVTGRNGYEELVVACDHLKASKRYAAVTPDSATLSEMREVLSDRHVVDCLRMVQAGLSKPVHSPRTSLNFTTSLPELSAFRSIARLLRMQQRVLLADGRHAEAVQSFRSGLVLGRVIQFDSLIQGLVGTAVVAIQAKSIGENLDHLDARDCQELYQICLSELRQPDPTMIVLDGERRFVRGSVQEMGNEVRKKGIAAVRESLGLTEEQARVAGPFIDGLRADPQAVALLADQVQQRIDQYYIRVFEEAKKRPWERGAIDGPESTNDGTPAGFATSMLLPAASSALESMTAREAYLRLIAVHCAIRRFDWENGNLPGTLDELRLGDLALDPFTGERFRYVRHDSRYTLAAAGRHAGDNDPKAVGGRHPIAISRDDL